MSQKCNNSRKSREKPTLNLKHKTVAIATVYIFFNAIILSEQRSKQKNKIASRKGRDGNENSKKRWNNS